MMDVLEKTFPEILKAQSEKLKEILPFWKTEINRQSFNEQLSRCEDILDLKVASND